MSTRLQQFEPGLTKGTKVRSLPPRLILGKTCPGKEYVVALCLVAAACNSACGAHDAGDGADGAHGGLAPVSEELIAADLAAGKIDEKTAALYRLLAAASPSRLPPAYRGAVDFYSAPSVTPQLVARAHLSEYGPTEAAAVKAMLTDPEDPDWMVFPDQLPAGNFAKGAHLCRANFDGAHGGGRFFGTLHETNHFRIRGLLPKLGDVPAQEAIEKRIADALEARVPGVGGSGSIPFKDYLDAVYDYYRDTLKMHAPADLPVDKQMKKVAANGGKIPIYVATCDGLSNDALATEEGFIFVSVGLAFEDGQLRRVVIPHELFHLFEFTYTDSFVHSWPFESSAVVAEDLVAPDVRRWSGAFADSPNGNFAPIDRSFQCPEEPLHDSSLGPCQHRLDSTRHYSGEYSKWVLLKFLMRNFGLRLADFWQLLSDNGGDASKLLVPSQVAQFQLALLGDLAGQAPFFDPGDRAAFYRAGKPSVHRAPSDADRYTYRADPNAVSSSLAFRFTPADESSRSVTLRRLDATASPIPPMGTQRLLFEVPDVVAAHQEPNADHLEVFLQLTGCSQCGINAVPALRDGADPGPVLDATGASWSQTSSLPGPKESFLYLSPGYESTPHYVAVVISNFGDGPVTWRGGFTLTAACEKACGDYYKDYQLQKQCPEYLCQDYTDEQHASCLDANTKTTRSHAMGFFCPYLCSNTPDGTSQAYVSVTDSTSSCPNIDQRQDICANGGVPSCIDIPATFVPVAQWPQVACSHIMLNCPDSGCLCEQ